MHVSQKIIKELLMSKNVKKRKKQTILNMLTGQKLPCTATGLLGFCKQINNYSKKHLFKKEENFQIKK